jgi:tetratricopeptide (TPR) repeat protein
MNKTNDHTEIIDQYLNKELSDIEAFGFEKRIEEEPALKEQFQLMSEMYEMYSDVDALEFREKMNQVVSGTNNKNSAFPKKARLRFLNTTMFKAASILVLIGAITIMYIMFNNNNYDTEKLFASNYTFIPCDEINRSDIARNSISDKILIAYNNHDFDKVVSQYEHSKNKISSNYKLLLYIGIAYIELERYDMSIDLYNTVQIPDNERLISDYIIWYKGLCLLKLGKTPEAKKEFRLLVGQKGFKQKKVMAILKEIE